MEWGWDDLWEGREMRKRAQGKLIDDSKSGQGVASVQALQHSLQAASRIIGKAGWPVIYIIMMIVIYPCILAGHPMECTRFLGSWITGSLNASSMHGSRAIHERRCGYCLILCGPNL